MQSSRRRTGAAIAVLDHDRDRARPARRRARRAAATRARRARGPMRSKPGCARSRPSAPTSSSAARLRRRHARPTRAAPRSATARRKPTEAGDVLQKPRSGSLLRFLWPACRGSSSACSRRGAGLPVRTQVTTAGLPPLLSRLPWPPSSAPEPARSPPRDHGAAHPRRNEGSIRPEFDWAGTIAQAVGEVVHLELQRSRALAAHARR